MAVKQRPRCKSCGGELYIDEDVPDFRDLTAACLDCGEEDDEAFYMMMQGKAGSRSRKMYEVKRERIYTDMHTSSPAAILDQESQEVTLYPRPNGPALKCRCNAKTAWHAESGTWRCQACGHVIDAQGGTQAHRMKYPQQYRSREVETETSVSFESRAVSVSKPRAWQIFRNLTGSPSISIGKGGSIGLNRLAYELLKCPTHVTLMYDTMNGAIGMKAAPAGDSSVFLIRDSYRTKHGRAGRRIYAYAFCKLYGLMVEKSIALVAHLEHDILVIELPRDLFE
jgi:hypothetical protein